MKIKNLKKKAKKLLKMEYTPVKQRDLKAVCFETKDPRGDGKYNSYLFHAMEWVNGEGLDISFNFTSETTTESKFYSFSHTELEGILACMGELGYLD